MAGLFGGSALGDSLGQVLISVGLDTKPLEAGLAKVKTETAAAGTAAQTGFSKFTNTLQTAIPIAAGIAGVALVKFAAASVGAAVDAANQQAKLANAVQNSASVTSAAIPVFQAQAQALRDLTGVDDDAINAMQGFIIQMGLTQDQVTQLTPLIVDLSVKMGVSLDTAAKAVGKSVNGTITGLSRMGVVVDKAKAAVDPFAATLEALGATAGFAAQKAKAEPWILLSAQFHQMQEDVGAKLLPILQDLVPKLTAVAEVLAPLLVKSFADAAEAATNLGSILGGLIDLIPGVGGESDKASNAVSLFGKAMDVLPFAQNILASEELTKGLKAVGLVTEDLPGPIVEVTAAWQDNLDTTHDVVDAYNGARDAFISAGRAVTRFAGMSGKALKEWKTSVKESFASAIYDLSNLDSNFGVTVRDFIKGSRAMEQRGRQLARAMHELASKKDSWVPEDYVKFLTDEGPGFLVAFTNLNGQQQHKAVAQWKGTNQQVQDLNGTVDSLGQKIRQVPEVKNIKVNVDYYYNGYRPEVPIPGGP